MERRRKMTKKKLNPVIIKLSELGYPKVSGAYEMDYCMNVADIRRMLWDAEPDQPVVVMVDDMSVYPYHGVDSVSYIDK